MSLYCDRLPRHDAAALSQLRAFVLKPSRRRQHAVRIHVGKHHSLAVEALDHEARFRRRAPAVSRADVGFMFAGLMNWRSRVGVGWANGRAPPLADRPIITTIQEKNPAPAIDLPRLPELLERTFIRFMLRCNICA
jgi:hypothetical protein